MSLNDSIFTLEGPNLRLLGASPPSDVTGALLYIQNGARARYGAYPGGGTVATLGVVEAVTRLFAPATEGARETADSIYGVYSRDLQRARTRWANALAQVLSGPRTPMPGATLLGTVLAAPDAALFWDEAMRFAIQLTAILNRPETVSARGLVSQAVAQTPAIVEALPPAALPASVRKKPSRLGWWIAGAVGAAVAIGGGIYLWRRS